VGLSVSRIGTKVMWKALKKLSASLRLEYLQYRELLKISRLKASGAGSSEESQDQMKGGEILSVFLRQLNDHPSDMVEQVILFYGLAKKLIYDLDNDQILHLRDNGFAYAQEHFPELVKELREKKDLTEDIERQIEAFYTDYIKVLERTVQAKVEE